MHHLRKIFKENHPRGGEKYFNKKDLFYKLNCFEEYIHVTVFAP
jgi:hypothetical protein